MIIIIALVLKYEIISVVRNYNVCLRDKFIIAKLKGQGQLSFPVIINMINTHII